MGQSHLGKEEDSLPKYLTLRRLSATYMYLFSLGYKTFLLPVSIRMNKPCYLQQNTDLTPRTPPHLHYF